MMLAPVLPALRQLRAQGKTYHRTRKCGARGTKRIKDMWKWPPKKQQYLFPNQWGTGPKTKDVVAHAITKARKTFQPTKSQACVLETGRIRSHSGRHRMINDLKASSVPPDAAMVFARIKHKKTFDNYGRMDQEQSGKLLNSNNGLKRTLKTMYK